MVIHTMVFVHEHGHVVGSYPLDGETDNDKVRMSERFNMANNNPSCIAAFWWRDGVMHKYQFNRA